MSVKPHASPVLHAIEYLLGRLDRSYLTRLRDFGGLQSYPSRTKDPFPVDFSTGSVGLGSAAPLFGALADRYVELARRRRDRRPLHLAARRRRAGRGQHLGGARRPADARARQRALDRRPQPAVARPGRPGDQGAGAGAQLRDGRLARGRAEVRPAAARGVRARRAASVLRARIDEMPNEQYQSLFARERARSCATRCSTALGAGVAARARPAARAGTRATSARSSATSAGTTSRDVLDALAAARAETDRPTVDLRVHDQGVRAADRRPAAEPLRAAHAAQIDTLRAEAGLTPATEWDAFDADTTEGALLRGGRARWRERPRPAAAARSRCRRRCRGGIRPKTSTQAAFGRVLLDLSRVEGVAERLVTVAPDVSIVDQPRRLHQQDRRLGPGRETRLRRDGGLAAALARRPARPAHRDGDRGDEPRAAARPARPQLGRAGRAAVPDRHALRPVRDARARRDRLLGVLRLAVRPRRHAVGDLAVARGRRAPVDHRRPGSGSRRPALTYAEPCYARELEWLLLDALARMQEPDGRGDSTCGSRRRRSTRRRSLRRRRASARRRRERTSSPAASGCASRRGRRRPGDPRRLRRDRAGGARAPPSSSRTDEGVEATVLCLSSPDRLYRGWRAARRATAAGRAGRDRAISTRLLAPDERGVPVVTVIDGASHALAWLGQRARHAVRAARRRRVRPDRQPTRALRGVRDRRGSSHDGGAGRARALAKTSADTTEREFSDDLTGFEDRLGELCTTSMDTRVLVLRSRPRDSVCDSSRRTAAIVGLARCGGHGRSQRVWWAWTGRVVRCALRGWSSRLMVPDAWSKQRDHEVGTPACTTGPDGGRMGTDPTMPDTVLVSQAAGRTRHWPLTSREMPPRSLRLPARRPPIPVRV